MDIPLIACPCGAFLYYRCIIVRQAGAELNVSVVLPDYLG